MFVRGNVLSRTMEDAIRLTGPVFYEAFTPVTFGASGQDRRTITSGCASSARALTIA